MVFEVQDLSEPSVNAAGDIVTLGDTEYRWRDGYVFARVGEGDSVKVDWNSVPREVRDMFNERINYG